MARWVKVRDADESGSGQTRWVDIGDVAAEALRGLPGIKGEKGERGDTGPSAGGSTKIFEQMVEPLQAMPGDFWIER